MNPNVPFASVILRFDRDLGIAGRIIVRGDDGSLQTKLVRIDTPIARIPNLAIHLTAGSEREHFAPNLHEHAKAILTMDPEAIKLKLATATDIDAARLHPFLVQLVAAEAGVPAETIIDMELQLIDVQPSTVGGGSRELIFSGRLDNLCSSYQCLRALVDGSGESIDAQPNVRSSL